MFAKKTNTENSCSTEEAVVRKYSLEAIMALQKALEPGLQLDDLIPYQSDTRAKRGNALGKADDKVDPQAVPKSTR